MIGGQARPNWVATGVLVGLAALMVFPVAWMLILSIKPEQLMFSRPPVWTFTPTLEHYHQVLVEKGYTRAVLNSLILSFGSTALVALVGTPAAYSLARFPIWRRDDWLLFILGTRMAPPIALVIPFYLIFGKLKLLNTHTGIIVAYLTFNLSFYIWILRSFCREIPIELEEAALTEGYSRWHVFSRIVLPLLRPGIIATSVLCLIFAWNEFLYAFILGGREVQTLPVAIPSLITPRGVQWGALAAIGLLAVIPVLVAVCFLQRHIVRGLTMGAVRG